MPVKKSLHLLLIILSTVMINSCAKNGYFPAKVIFIEGSAEIQTNGSKKPLELNQIIRENDTVITGTKSIVTLMLNNVSAIRISENTVFEISKITKSSNDELLDTLYNLKKGRVFGIFNKISSGSSAIIKTPVSVVAVRGTAFSVAATDDKGQPATALQVVEGKVEINSIAKSELSEIVSAGEQVEFGKENIVKEKSAMDPETSAESAEEFIQLQESVDKINKTPRNYDELKKSIQTTPPSDNEKKSASAAAPVFRTEQEIRNYYKRLERVKLDDGSVLIGAIIFQDSKNVKINTVNGIITLPAKSVVESKMIYK